MRACRGELEKLRKDAAQRAGPGAAAGGVAEPQQAGAAELRQLEQQLRDARTRQQAMAAGVKLLRADQPVRLDGQPLQVGDEQRLSTVFQLQVGDGVVLEIAPGGGQALEDLERTVQNSTSSFGPSDWPRRRQRGGLRGAAGAANRAGAATGRPGRRGAGRARPAGAAEGWLEQRLVELDGELQELADAETGTGTGTACCRRPSVGCRPCSSRSAATSKHTGTASTAAERELEAARSGVSGVSAAAAQRGQPAEGGAG